MKTTVFELVGMESRLIDGPFQVFEYSYRVPSLPAYAVLHHSIDYTCDLGFETSLERPRSTVAGDRVVINSDATMAMSFLRSVTLSITYTGVRDYSLLFPHVKNEALRNRLGQFAEEADKAFDEAAWMSFVLMAGAVIEGLLMSRFGKKIGFYDLINRAGDKGIFSPEAQAQAHQVRDTRNLVHAGRFEKPFVDRKLAMDTYIVYDRLLKRRWDLDS